MAALIVSVPEPTLLTNQINTRTRVYPTAFFLQAGLLYFLVGSVLSSGAGYLERKLRHR